MATALERGARLNDLSYAGNKWTDPRTGFVVPKRLIENIELRRKLRQRCDGSAAARREMLRACSDSMLLWINLFVDTFKPLELGPDYVMRPSKVRDLPFITWPGQDPALLAIEALTINGGDASIDKSRNMGASWMCELPLMHQWLFRTGKSFKLMSRKEELVDNPADPDSLFWKLDYVLEHLPEWMVPKKDRSSMRLVNVDGRNVINGESTNKHAARGGRRDVILIDEAAAIDQLDSILRSTHMGVACRLFNSTPVGPGAYTNMVFGGKVKVIFLPWWDHPEFGAGRYWTTDDKGNRIISSPWRDHEVATKSSKEVATNIDMDHLSAGSTFFDLTSIQHQRAVYAVDPLMVGSLTFTKRVTELTDVALQMGDPAVKFSQGAGKWKLWVPLQAGRPAQDRRYCFGIDIAHGLGDSANASNSVIFVGDVDTGEQVAEYADPGVEPGALARIACAAGLWFGGAEGCAYMAWESNGPGLTFAKNVRRLGYPWVYSMVKSDKRVPVVTDRAGWFSTPDTKLELYQEGRADLATSRLIVRSLLALNELAQIIFLPSGHIGPAVMAEESSEARATHGDRVTAAMVFNHARKFAGRTRPKRFKPVPGTVAEDLAKIEEEIRRGDMGPVADETF